MEVDGIDSQGIKRIIRTTEEGYVINAGISPQLQHAVDVIKSTYNVNVSVDEKRKDLLKFGVRTTEGTGWETLMETAGSETEETFVSTNIINALVSSSSSDDETVGVEYHTTDGTNATFGVQMVALNGQTSVAFGTDAFRVSRIYNVSTTPLAGTVYAFEGSTGVTSGIPDNKTKVHAVIDAGEQQTQKAQTTISSVDYWIIANISLSVLSKTSAYAEARLEAKPVSQSYWRPVSQNFASSDSSGTIELLKEPFIIVPSNYDVRIAVKTNASGVQVAGGFSGYLAIVE